MTEYRGGFKVEHFPDRSLVSFNEGHDPVIFLVDRRRDGTWSTGLGSRLRPIKGLISANSRKGVFDAVCKVLDEAVDPETPAASRLYLGLSQFLRSTEWDRQVCVGSPSEVVAFGAESDVEPELLVIRDQESFCISQKREDGGLDLLLSIRERSAGVWSVLTSRFPICLDCTGTSMTGALRQVVSRLVGQPSTSWHIRNRLLLEVQGSVQESPKQEPPVDAINPAHYRSHPSGIECIQITESMNFCVGNAVKYLFRCGLKNDAVEDLEKAIWYLRREVKRLKGLRAHGEGS